MNKTPKQDLRSVSPNGDTPRISLIGCGAIAEAYYLPALAKHPNVLKALTLVDQNIDRARKLAESFNGGKRCVTDYREAIHETDGAIIALPTHLHHPIAMDLLARGMPVLCEKPLAETADKAREMVELADRKGTALATNYSQRLWSQFAKVKELFLNRSLGDPMSIKYYVGELFKWPTVSGFYFNSANSPRGVLLDRGAHVLDHICWWLGGHPTVTSSRNDSFGGIDAVAHVQFRHGQCVGEVKISWLSNFASRFVVEFKNGTIEGDVSYPESVFLKKGTGRKKRIKLKSVGWYGLGDMIVSNFLGVISKDEKPLVPGNEVLDSMIMVDECYAAAERFEMPWYEIKGMVNVQ